MTNTKKIVILGLLISQALVLSIIERFIPIPIPIPGIKLGLANIISLFTIMVFGFKEATILVLLRVTISSIFTGGIAGFFYSISGGLISVIVMSFIYNKFRNNFSIISISIIGSIFHNIGQLITASIVVMDFRVFYYFPALLISGTIMGIIIGFTTKYAVEPAIKILKL